MIPIDYVSFINQTGYAQAAVANIIALHESGKYDVRINCIHKTINRSAFSRPLHQKLVELTKKPQNPRSVQIFHTIPPMHRRVHNLRKKLAYATFETFSPPKEWITYLNRMDGVIVASKFNQKTFTHHGVKRPISHIPHAIDFRLWNEDVGKMHNHDRFTFLFVGTWRKRKGWDLLLEAWANEFSSLDNVQLIIKTDRTDRAETEAKNYLRRLKKDYAPILFEKEIFDETAIPSFFRSADCFICPTLGEGFGLPAAQSMALRVPVIITNFSGCVDYANDERCTLLEPNGFMIHDCLDNIPQFSNQKWPRLRVEDIQSAMRNVIKSPKHIADKADRAYDFVRENFSYDRTVSLFDDMMERVYSANTVETTTV